MAKIQFRISAKAARLIGRENITGVDGAIIELVKNAYDADATCIYLLYDIKYPYLAQTFDYEIISSDLSEDEMKIFSKLYHDENGLFCKVSKDNFIEAHITESKNIDDISRQYAELELSVQRILFTRNKIVLIDNGCGMSKEIVENSWMRIGTSYKETNYISERGRVKTGAKGIGRFALSRLSLVSWIARMASDSE